MADLFLGFVTSNKTNSKGNLVSGALILSTYTNFSEENTEVTLELVGLRMLGLLCKDGLVFLPEMFGRKLGDNKVNEDLSEFFSISKHGLVVNTDRKEVYDRLNNRVMYNKGIVISEGSSDRLDLAIAEDKATEDDYVALLHFERALGTFGYFEKVKLKDLDSTVSIYSLDKDNFKRIFSL